MKIWKSHSLLLWSLMLLIREQVSPNFPWRSRVEGHQTRWANNYSVWDNAPTKRGARTMGLDLKTHKVVLPAADFLPPREGKRRGEMKLGSFVLLVVTR